MVEPTRNTNRETPQQPRREESISRLYGASERSLHMNPWIERTTPKEEVKKKVEVSDADKLNPSDEREWTFKNKNGAIQYANDMLYGCCGVAVVYNVFFGNIKEGMKEQFYKDVEEHLLSNGGSVSGNLARGSIMMSDAVGGEKKQSEKGLPSIYEMCTVLGWEKTSQYYNPRSGNYVEVFMKEREVTGGNCEVAREDNPMVLGE